MQNVYYGVEHCSLLLPHGQQLYTTYDNDKIQAIQDNVPVPTHHFNPSTSLDEISNDLFGQMEILDMVRLTFTAKYPVRECNDFVLKVRRTLEYLIVCDSAIITEPYTELTNTVRKCRTVNQLLVLAVQRA